MTVLAKCVPFVVQMEGVTGIEIATVEESLWVRTVLEKHRNCLWDSITMQNSGRVMSQSCMHILKYVWTSRWRWIRNTWLRNLSPMSLCSINVCSWAIQSARRHLTLGHSDGLCYNYVLSWSMYFFPVFLPDTCCVQGRDKIYNTTWNPSAECRAWHIWGTQKVLSVCWSE